MSRRWVIAAAMVLTSAGSALGAVQITVYNDNLALVKDTRTLQFQKGTFELPFADVASAIDPTSVAFTALDHPNAIALLEQNYRYDLVSSDKLLEKYLDRAIRVVTKQDKVHEGVLLASDGTTLTLKKPDGTLAILNRSEVADLSLSSLPEGLITRPTLVWTLNSDVSGPERAEVRYLTGQIGWHAEYIATVNAAEDALNLAGWVSIDNHSGATYPDATIKLIAGDVNRARERGRPLTELSVLAKAAPAFEEKAFFEYHLYTLKRPATVRDNEIKQLSLFEPAAVRAQKVYTYDGGRDDDKVRVTMEFVNSTASGLGMPLPKGKIRVMKADSDGSLEFVGEDQIDHTPKDEKVRALLGNAFDVVGERVQTDHTQISPRVYDETIEITLRNHKSDSVTVVVVEHFWGDWTITDESQTHVKKDALTAEWRLPVAADGQAKLRYTVRHQS